MEAGAGGKHLVNQVLRDAMPANIIEPHLLQGLPQCGPERLESTGDLLDNWLRVLQIGLSSCGVWRHLLLQGASPVLSCGRSLLRLPGSKPATTPMPGPWSANACPALLVPPRARPTRGPPCTRGSDRVLPRMLGGRDPGRPWQ